MSLLLIEVVPQGIVFGADKNITNSTVFTRQNGTTGTINHGQTKGQKVFLWSNRNVLIGCVGILRIGETPLQEWLEAFEANAPHYPTIEILCAALTGAIQAQFGPVTSSDQMLIVMVGGFEQKDGVVLPVVYEIRNYHAAGPDVYDDIDDRFEYLEVPFPNDVKTYLKKRADNYDPFWIHQGIGLQRFYLIERFLKTAFKTLSEIHPDHHFPRTLSEWEQQVKMSINTYAAYFQSYHKPNEQLVGGGVDTFLLPWPA